MNEGPRKLSEEELFQCLKSLNVPVRLNDLKTPTKEFIIRVFECCLKDLQIDIRNPNVRPWHAIQHIDYPEICEEAQMLTLLLYGINFLTQPDGLLLSLKDITEPKPKRTKKILNYLIVFWNFCMTKYAQFQALDEEFQEQRKRIANLTLENDILEEKYQDLLGALNNFQPSKEELSHTVSAKTAKIHEYEKLQINADAEYKDLKKKLIDLQNQISAVDIDIISVKESINELDQHILASPEQFTNEIQRLKELIKDDDIKVKEKEMELKKKTNHLETVKMSQENIVKATDFLQSIETGLIELRNSNSCIASEKERLKQEEDQVKELQAELDLKVEAKYSSEEKAIKVQLNSKKQLDMYSQTIKTLSSDVQRQLKGIEDSKKSALDLKWKSEKETADVLEIIEKCKEAQSEAKKTKSAFVSQMEIITREFCGDCSGIKEQIKKNFGM